MKTNKFFLLVGLLIAFNVSFAQERVNIREGWYFLRCKTDNDLYIGLKKGSATAGQNIQLCAYNDSSSEQWYFEKDENEDGTYVIYSGVSNANSNGYVLGIKNGTIQNNQNIELQKYNGSLSQRWVITRDPYDNNYYMIRSAKNTNFVIDIAKSDFAIGSNIELYKDNDGKIVSQKWGFAK